MTRQRRDYTTEFTEQVLAECQQIGNVAQYQKGAGFQQVRSIHGIDFVEQLWYTLVGFATVYSENHVRFTFKGDTEIQAQFLRF